MLTRAALVEEFETLVDTLASDHRELATTRVGERRTKVEAYARALDARTNADRQHAGDLAALNMTCDVFTLQGKIAAHEARIDFIKTALANLPAEG